MSRAERTLIAGLTMVGAPALIVAIWQDLLSQHPLAALAILIAWVVLVMIGSMIAPIAAEIVKRRLAQLATDFDQRLSRRISRYEHAYRTWILESPRRFLELKGLATPGDFTPELDDVFVDLSLAPQSPNLVPGGLLAGVPVDVTQRRSIWEFLNRPQPHTLAVIGAPGSGKTTLLRHVARRIAQSPKEFRRPVPILLELRDYAPRIIADPAVSLPRLLRETLPALKTSEPPGWWESCLRQGRCVVLLDGLDEVARPDERTQVTRWVNRLIAANPANDYVVTSRPHGYRTAAIDTAQVTQVRPFTDDQVRLFLRGWYLAVERRVADDSGRGAEIRAEEAANDLTERLAATSALHDLTVNPLLLTMIVNVHRYRGSLPGSRADLYSEVCQVMLWRRGEAKGLPAELLGPSKERLLAKLAFAMMRRRVSVLRTREMMQFIRPGLRKLAAITSADDFLIDISATGLLVEHEHDHYAFAHLTFQEYLAGKHIRESNLQRILTAAVDDPWWRETTLLAMAGGDADQIARACIESGTINALSLAFECTETGAELSVPLRDRLNGILALAFDAHAFSAHRLLVAGVLATRQLRHVNPTSAGTRICVRPVSANLYQLFLQDTGVPPPDGARSAEPAETSPVTGVWAHDAVSFVSWINTVAAGSGETRYRLPTGPELDDLAATGGPAYAALAKLANVWTRADGSHLELWTAPGNRSPHELTGADLLSATILDTGTWPTLAQLISVHVHVRVRAFGIRLAGFTGLRVPPAPESVNPFVSGRSTVRFTPGLRDYVDAVNATVRSWAPGEEVFEAQRAVYARETNTLVEQAAAAVALLADAFGPDADTGQVAVLPDDHVAPALGALDAARTNMDILGSAFHRSGQFDRETRVVGNTRERMAEHMRVLVEARKAADRLAVALAELGAVLPALHTVSHHALAFDRLGRSDLPEATGNLGDPLPSLKRALEKMIGTGLAAGVSHALIPPYAINRMRHTFAAGLAQAATIAETDRFVVALDTMSDTVRKACRSFAGRPTSPWSRTLANRLAEIAEPMFARRRALCPDDVTAVRMAALALAAEADPTIDPDLAHRFKTIAAGVTLLQLRAEQPKSLESIILAVA